MTQFFRIILVVNIYLKIFKFLCNLFILFSIFYFIDYSFSDYFFFILYYIILYEQNSKYEYICDFVKILIKRFNQNIYFFNKCKFSRVNDLNNNISTRKIN